MIPFSTPRRIAAFSYDDIVVSPKGNEEFFGIPVDWHGCGCEPSIEVRVDGEVVKTINCRYVKEVDFEKN